MAYAVVASGGKQYVARPGETIEVDRLPMEKDASVDFKEVLLIADDGNVQVGTPFVEGALVTGKVDDQVKGPKIIVFKYKPKIRYRRKQGHRQLYTRVAIEEVVMPGAEKKRAPKADKAEKTAKPEKPAASKSKKAAAPSKAAPKSSAKKEAGDEAAKAAAKPPAKKTSPKKPVTGKKGSSSKPSASPKKPASRSTKKKSE